MVCRSSSSNFRFRVDTTGALEEAAMLSPWLGHGLAAHQAPRVRT